jgi:hypothetical protein
LPLVQVFITGAVLLAIGASQLIYSAGLGTTLLSDDWYQILWLADLQRSGAWTTIFEVGAAGWFRPVQWLTTFAIYAAFGTNPVPYHALSQGIDLLNAVLLGTLVYQFLSGLASWTHPSASRAALLAVALFALNWRHNEAVFWSAAINEPLSTCFRLASLNVVLRWSITHRRYAGTLAVASVATALALASKESGFLVPVETAALLGLCLFEGALPRARLKQAALIVAAQLVWVIGWALLYLRAIMLTPGRTHDLEFFQGSAVEWAMRYMQYVAATYGGTGGPLRSEWVLAVEAVIALGLTALAVRDRRRLWLFALAWCLVAVTPYVMQVPYGLGEQGVDPLDLGILADRYLYYGSAAATLLLILSAAWLRDGARKLLGDRVGADMWTAGLGLCAAAILVVSSMQLARLGSEWRMAGRMAAIILEQVREPASRLRAGDTLCLQDLPDDYDRRYVFHKGAAEAVWLTLGRRDFAILATTSRLGPDALQACSTLLDFNAATWRLEPVVQ